LSMAFQLIASSWQSSIRATLARCLISRIIIAMRCMSRGYREVIAVQKHCKTGLGVTSRLDSSGFRPCHLGGILRLPTSWAAARTTAHRQARSSEPTPKSPAPFRQINVKCPWKRTHIRLEADRLTDRLHPHPQCSDMTLRSVACVMVRVILTRSGTQPCCHYPPVPIGSVRGKDQGAHSQWCCATSLVSAQFGLSCAMDGTNIDQSQK